jgi:hypothetical protein
MAISWYTIGAASNPQIIYSNKSSFVDSKTVTPSKKIIGSTHIYTANISGLQSNTTYFYNITDLSSKRETMNFTTAPNRTVKNVKFVVFGDSRTGREARREIAKTIVETFDDLDFSVHTGDIVENGNDQNQWNEYFNDTEVLNKRIPGYYIEGNHERINGYMYDNIPLPSNGLNSYYYNFSVGPVSFFGLNTNRDVSIQTSWLNSVLNQISRDNNTFWRFAFFHEPFFNSFPLRSDRDDLISSWSPLFEDFNFDITFAGHNHYYERTYPINQKKKFDNSSLFNFLNPKDPIYVTTGGAGAPLYTREEAADYFAYYNSTYHFTVVEIEVDNVNKETALNMEVWGIKDDAGIFKGPFLFDNITIVKKGAEIKINDPDSNQLFGNDSPNFNIEIVRRTPNQSWYTLESMWYSMDKGLSKHQIDKNGTTNQDLWDAQGNGTVNLRFYANDTFGNIDFTEVEVRKDIYAPIISMKYPKSGDLFGKIAPDFDLSINEANLDALWYIINNETTLHFVNGTFGTINQSGWDLQPNGTVKINFFSNDTVGNTNYYQVSVRKDILAPIIAIKSPKAGYLFNKSAPYFELSINEANLDNVWYSINNDTKIYFLNGSSGTIDQSGWDLQPNGTVTIKFFANDTLGNTNNKAVTIRRYALAPSIKINSPGRYENFGYRAPRYNVTVIDPFLDTMWYSIDYGETTYTFDTNGTINQEAWDKTLIGGVTITFYANNSLGFSNQTTITIVKTILLDELDPIFIATLFSIVGFSILGIVIAIVIIKKKILLIKK